PMSSGISVSFVIMENKMAVWAAWINPLGRVARKLQEDLIPACPIVVKRPRMAQSGPGLMTAFDPKRTSRTQNLCHGSQTVGWSGHVTENEKERISSGQSKGEAT